MKFDGCKTNCEMVEIAPGQKITIVRGRYRKVRKSSLVCRVFEYTDPFDTMTYLFKGNYVYAYNEKDETIEAGYPKKIREVYGGLPKNIKFIDAIWTDNINKIVYFFKGPLFYRFTGEGKIFENGKKITDLWTNTPSNIIIKLNETSS